MMGTTRNRDKHARTNGRNRLGAVALAKHPIIGRWQRGKLAKLHGGQTLSTMPCASAGTVQGQ
jgi:hypothetical protein